MTATAAPRERVLEAARALFYADGIGATGVDALAARAGVSKRTLYRDFGSKDAVIAAYVERFGEPGAIPPEDILADEGRPGRERVLDAFDALLVAVRESGWRGCPITGATVELADAQHPARPVGAAHKARFRERAEAALADHGVAVGERSARAQEIAMLWDGAIVQALAGGSAEPVAVARRAVERLLDG